MTTEMALVALLGGALIGVSATGLLLVHGRAAGISGILGGLVARPNAILPWRLGFVLGLVGVGVACGAVWPDSFAYDIERSDAMIAVAGLLVGFGTQLGSGCTSGHGVCGISAFSLRGLVATCTFMATGALTVVLLRTLGGVG